MIYSIVGRPGEGKSFFAVSLIRKFLESGIDVYINILVDESSLKLKSKRPGTLYYWKSLSQFRYVENGVVIIDEAASYFEARNWSKFSVDDKVKFQQHRKEKLDIYVISQSFSRIESSIRQLVAYVYEMKKFSLPGITFFRAHTFVPEEIDLKTRKSLGTKYISFDQKVANAYDTYEKVNLLLPPRENKFKLMKEFFQRG